jgi:hypothetical protein
MPITIGTVTLEQKLLPLTLNPDGSASITLRRGWVDAGEFHCIGDTTHNFTTDEVSLVLDTPPIVGLTRRDDLSLAVYQMMVTKGITMGEIS